MQIFIDANVYLGFYNYTGEDLEELNKLIVLVEQKKVSLYITDQVIDEFRRNRARVIADALKRLRDQRLSLAFPAFCKDYEEYQTLRKLQKEFEKEHSALIERVTGDIESRALKADKVIEKLFATATRIKTTDEVIAKARLRMQVGNPPGKDDSIGDAINWLGLLSNVPNKEDLFIVSDDRDFTSSLDDTDINEFLGDEWLAQKKSDIIFYRRLSEFFKDEFPEIKLATELEKQLLVERLAGSGSFVATHNVIAALSQYADFSEEQVNAIAEAAIANNQVGWIIGDEDLREFYGKLLADYGEKLDPALKEKVEERLAPPPDPDPDPTADAPF